MRKIIFDTVTDMVSKFLYYDRKEDDELPVGAIDQAIKDGVITVNEIVDEFRNQLNKGLDL